MLFEDLQSNWIAIHISMNGMAIKVSIKFAALMSILFEQIYTEAKSPTGYHVAKWREL